MNGLDLFSGIGGITKALEGYVKPIAYCENDRYAQAVLLSRMACGDLPTAPVWDDVRTLKATHLPSPISIIYGGFPCQDLSLAGRRKGLEGERSGLFFEIIRLAEETKAPFIFLENVPGVRTKGLGRVLKELDSIGYDCRWGLLSAADVGANHKRERWFLLAYSRNAGFGFCMPGGAPQINGSSSSERRCSNVADSNRESSTQKDSPPRSVGEGRNSRPNDSRCNGGSIPGNDWWVSEPGVGRMVDGVLRRVDRLRALGNAVVPAQAREAFERLMGLK